MKLFGSLLVASAFGATIWGPGNKSDIPRSEISSGLDKLESGLDHIMGGMPERPESPHSGHKSGSPKSGHKSGSGHQMSGKKDEKHNRNGCGGNCGAAENTNVNFAPVNTNVQNFINIETDINTNINVGVGGGSSSGGHHFNPIGIHHPHGEGDGIEEEWTDNPTTTKSTTTESTATESTTKTPTTKSTTTTKTPTTKTTTSKSTTTTKTPATKPPTTKTTTTLETTTATCNDNQYYSNPSDCRKFFHCDLRHAIPGHMVPFDCQNGLAFDMTILGCNFEASVDCCNGQRPCNGL